MSYGRFVSTHPLFWAFLAGFCLGVAAAAATRRIRHRGERFRSRKWTSTWLWLTAAVVCATLGIFLSDGFLALPSAYVAAGSAVFAVLAFRFPRAGGIPAFFVAAFVSIAGPLVMRPFVPIRRNTAVATMTVLAASDAGFFVEVTADGETSTTVLPEATAIAHGTRLKLSPYLFFLGGSHGVCYEGLSSDGVIAEGPPPYAEIPVIGRLVDTLPLMRIDSVVSTPVRIGLLRRYEILMDNDGIVRIAERPDE